MGFHRQADHAVLAVNDGDSSFNFIAFVQNVTCIFNTVTADFRGFQRSFDTRSQLNGCAFGINCDDLTGHDSAFVVFSNELRERIAFQLLHAQRDTLTLRVDRQDNGFQFVAFLVVTNRFFAVVVPGNVRQVNQTVDTTIQTDKDTEVSDGLDLTGDLVAFNKLSTEGFPWVHGALLDTQRNTTTFFVDIQNHHFHFVAQLDNFAWVDVLVGPVHFRNVYQTFNTFFQLSETAVVSRVGHACLNTGTFWVASVDAHPWIVAQLLQTQRNAVTLTVELQDFNVDLVTNSNDFAWVPH